MAGKRILVVDDEALIRELVRETLTIENYEVVTASSGSNALSQLAEQAVDLVLLDIRLGGGLSGLEVCSQISARSSSPPVIFLSGIIDEETVAAGREAGAVAYLTKPFSPLELISKVREQG